MSQIFRDMKVGLDEELEEKLAWMAPGFSSFHILKKSVDARRRHDPHLVYSVEVFGADETPSLPDYAVEKVDFRGEPPIIVGAGPAGLFAALRLLERGIPCLLLERGSQAEKRIMGINRYWRYGELDPNNNVCFGEGGAGLYSDGKLITRIKSPHIPYVMDRLIQFGAPDEIRYLSNPHVGSDRIRRVIPRLRHRLIELGCQIHFDCHVTEILTDESKTVTGVKTKTGQVFRSQNVILATGHSAEDILEHLHDIDVSLEGKSFAMGLRVEHPQKLIDWIQYREAAGHPKLGTANYKLAFTDPKDKVGIYSFCMCPGGYVLSSGTDDWGIVVNGMSNYNRNSPFANSAMVVTVDHDKSFGSDIFGGLKMRRELEKASLQMVKAAGGTKQIPAQRLVDFFEGRTGETIKSSSPSGVIPARLDQLLPPAMVDHLRLGFEKFSQGMPGFISDQAQFHAIESRTSCPIRVTRDSETLESVSHKGLYPAGEGAGYAGGITSAACDGVRIADVIAHQKST